MRIRWSRCSTNIVGAVILSIGCPAWQASAAGPLAEPEAVVKLGKGPTSIFAWDVSTLGVFDPTGPEVILYQLPVKAGSAPARLKLSATDKPRPGGSIYPDVVVRGGRGDINWLSRAGDGLRVFDSGGTFLRKVRIDILPFWMEVEGDGTPVISGLASRRTAAIHVAYAPDGQRIHTEKSWLEPTPLRDGSADVFSFSFPGGRRIDVGANVPYVHVSASGRETVLRLADCPGMPAWLSERLKELEKARGLPRPLGTGITGKDPLQPIVLAATARADGGVVAALNWSVLLKVRPPNWDMTCSPLPAPDAGVTKFALTSIASVGDRLAILSNMGGDGVSFRVWKAF